MYDQCLLLGGLVVHLCTKGKSCLIMHISVQREKGCLKFEKHFECILFRRFYQSYFIFYVASATYVDKHLSPRDFFLFYGKILLCIADNWFLRCYPDKQKKKKKKEDKINTTSW